MNLEQIIFEITYKCNLKCLFCYNVWKSNIYQMKAELTLKDYTHIIKKLPKATIYALSGGEPLFNQSNTSYQDFELPPSDEPALVAKICQYVGIEIREAEVVEFGLGEERVNTQETS